jgi:hypothetical protein
LILRLRSHKVTRFKSDTERSLLTQIKSELRRRQNSLKMMSNVFLVALFVVLSTGQELDSIDTAFYEEHCEPVVTNKRCSQLFYSYPKCVPWFTEKCDSGSKKQCTEFDCKVSLLFNIFVN